MQEAGDQLTDESVQKMTRSPRIQFDPALPISAKVDQIAELIKAHQVVIVAGETGSGKTTQLPKICLQLGRKSIAHTQPRRIAARSVAVRVAEELGVELGDLVGYQVRFTKQASKSTQLKLMTDGLLLAEINNDRLLRRYDTIIIDEAHERSLNIDFLLGYLKQLLPRRPDLKVIITSATIDTVRFSEHFNAPVVEVSGRGYPVEVRYQPTTSADPQIDQEASGEVDQADAIVEAVKKLSTEGPGDILVFLAGEREIRDTAEALSNAELGDTEILPLYARLSVAEQSRVFTPHAHRRVVLATNVAETSLTVPGIVYVVDPGFARISRYSVRTKVQRLPIETISQASANQRAGRCGRIAPGICVRLYSKEDFESRPQFTEPEILRTNLASVILQMAENRLGAIEDFPFIDPPDAAQVRDGVRLLEELGALRHRPAKSGGDELTAVGRKLAALPVDPRLARMLVEADRRDCLREVIVIAAGLAIQDVRERPVEQREQADQLHRRFGNDEATSAAAVHHIANPVGAPLRHTAHTSKTLRAQMTSGTKQVEAPDPGGDIMALLRLWQYLSDKRAELSGNQFRKMCRNEFLNYQRVREWQDLVTQLRDVCKEQGMHRNSTRAADAAILTSVLAGLLSRIGIQVSQAPKKLNPRGAGKPKPRGPKEFLGARQAKFAINPGSLLAKRPPEMVMAVELVETNRLWARQVAGIKSEWIEQVGGHLLKRGYSEPHWSSDSASVVAYEKATLYGVPIIADKIVDYARIDAEAARRIFIQAALVEGNWRPRPGKLQHDFLAHNAEQRERAEQLADRVRRQGVVVDDRDIARFYDAKLPPSVVSGDTFDAWWRTVDDKSVLEFSAEDLLDADSQVAADDFPGHWPVGDLELPVSYVFEPGSADDGVTVHIELAQLSGLSPEPFSWQVPGLRHELATELIRGLPKAVRTQLVPAPDRARQALDWLAAHDEAPRHGSSESFPLALARALTQLTGVVIDPKDWDLQALPAHLQLTFQVTGNRDERWRSADLGQLQARLSDRVAATLTKATKKSAKQTTTSWTFGTIQARTKVRGAGGVVADGYPAVQDAGDAVRLIMADTPTKQARTHASGVRRLLTLVNPDPSRWVVSHLSNVQKLALPNGPYPDVPSLLKDAQLKAVEQVAAKHADLTQVRDEASFERLALLVRQDQADQMRSVVATAAEIQTLAAQVSAVLTVSYPPAAADVQDSLDNLVFAGYLSFTRDPWLSQIPRYLRAMLQRLQDASEDPARDDRLAEPLIELQAELDELTSSLPPGPMPVEVDDLVFQLEELRVQTFAQTLGTHDTVSAKRIRKRIEQLRS